MSYCIEISEPVIRLLLMAVSFIMGIIITYMVKSASDDVVGGYQPKPPPKSKGDKPPKPKHPKR